jgi:hypothetical protein
MNFMEAVQALQNRECKAIRCNGGSAKYVINSLGQLVYKTTCIDGDAIRRDAEDYLGEWELVDPKPLTETKEIVRYIVVDDHGFTCAETYHSEEEALVGPRAAILQRGTATIVKFTGTYKVEVPRKVKKRIELKGFVGQSIDGTIVPLDANVFAEWEA